MLGPLLSAVLIAAVVATATPPPAAVRPVTQTFFDQSRIDPYHWMEDGGSELTDWMRPQAAYTDAVLAANPGRASVKAAMLKAFGEAGAASSLTEVRRIGGRVFYMQTPPRANGPSLFEARPAGGAPTVLIDGAALPPRTVLRWFVPSPDETKIAYAVGDGSERVTLHVRELASGRDTIEAIELDVIYGLVWRDANSFYYARTHATATDRLGNALLHRIGSPGSSDVVIAGSGVAGPLGVTESGANATLRVSENTVLVGTVVGVSPYVKVYSATRASAASPAGPWREIFTLADKVTDFELLGDRVFAISDREARRDIVVRPADGSGVVSMVAAQGTAFRMDMFANRAGLYVSERDGASMRLEHFDAAGKPLAPVALPDANSITALNGLRSHDAMTVHVASFNDAGHWYEVAGAAAKVTDLGIDPPVPPSYARTRISNGFARSSDGTQIPVSIIYADGTPRDGKRPALVLGYGAYGRDPFEPPAPPPALALLDFGMVLVLAHVRGGGEYGEPWHLAGKGAAKQHTIDDFIACTKYVADAGWTSPAKTAGLGGSAGGITIGNAIAQHPEMYAAAISQVGLNDMVDFERTPNGPGNIPEFGSVATPDGFRNLLAMSAYDHIAPQTRYPAVLLTTGLNDPRVAPWEVAKLAARLQASSTSGKPVLLRVDENAGHGIGDDFATIVNEWTDIGTFLLWQLGESGFQPA